MPIVVALFHRRDQALRALDHLRAEGFDSRSITILASPASAGEAAEQAAHELKPPAPGFSDLGGMMQGQADPSFAEAERATFEERIAQGDIAVRVDAAHEAAALRAEAILLGHGAQRVEPGTVRD